MTVFRSWSGIAVTAVMLCIAIPQTAIAGHQMGARYAESLEDSRFSKAEIHTGRVDRELIVRLKAGTDVSRMVRFNRRNNATITGSIPELNIYLLRLRGDADLGWTMRRYQRHPSVKYVEPNYLGRGGDLLPDDTHVAEQWHLDNRGQTGGTVDADIDAVEGWEITRGSRTVTVAILDTGILWNHPEFEGRISPGYDFVNGDSEAIADHSHGVFVAGLLAANADNAFGVAGIDRHANLLPVKVLDASNRGTTFELAQGLTYAAVRGADVVNMSLIDYPRLGKVLPDALTFARKAGSILVACAGNGGRGDADRSYPGASPLTLSVGATDHNDARADFSATGDALDVVAPGLNVLTVGRSPVADGSTSFSGCSAATPLVSGIAALLLSTDLDLSHELIRRILIQSAEDQVGPPEEDTTGRDEYYGFGRVNLDAALRLAASLQ